MLVGESRRVYVVCPVCGHAFRAALARTYVTVGREADLCPKIPGRPSDGAQVIRSSVTAGTAALAPTRAFSTARCKARRLGAARDPTRSPMTTHREA